MRLEISPESWLATDMLAARSRTDSKERGDCRLACGFVNFSLYVTYSRSPSRGGEERLMISVTVKVEEQMRSGHRRVLAVDIRSGSRGDLRSMKGGNDKRSVLIHVAIDDVSPMLSFILSKFECLEGYTCV
jgi:hypothetical protein